MALLQGVTNALTSPAPTGEGQPTPNAQRMGKFNELYVGSMIPTKHLAALSGYYYTATVGSTVVVTSLQTLTEASPAMVIENSGLIATGPSIILDYVRLKTLTNDANTTSWQAAWKLDNIRGKWGSGGSALTPQNASMGATNSSVATIHFGALVVATAQQSSNNARTICNTVIVPVAAAPATLLGDTVDMRFGALEAPMATVGSNVASNGAHTFAMGYSVALPPIVLAPGTTATLFLFSAAAGAQPAYEVNMGWFEY